MDISRRIFLYGNSVILGTLKATLQHCHQFEVTTITPSSTEYLEMETLKPDVIVFDLEASHPAAAFSLLETCPKLLLIGISPDTNQVQMWAGLKMEQLSTQGLLEVINEQLKNLPIGSNSKLAISSKPTNKSEKEFENTNQSGRRTGGY